MCIPLQFTGRYSKCDIGTGKHSQPASAMAAEVVHQHVGNAKDTNAVANWHVVILERESLASAGRAREENQRDSSPYGDHAGYELEKSLFWRGWLLSGRTHSRFLSEAHVHARIRGSPSLTVHEVFAGEIWQSGRAGGLTESTGEDSCGGQSATAVTGGTLYPDISAWLQRRCQVIPARMRSQLSWCLVPAKLRPYFCTACCR